MAACTFFGPTDCPDPIRDQLKALIEDLILNHDADTFYVGNEGLFDAMVRCILWDLRKVYPHIQYHVVLAHRPSQHITSDDLSEILLPGEYTSAESNHSKEWIEHWMTVHSNFIVDFRSSEPNVISV